MSNLDSSPLDHKQTGSLREVFAVAFPLIMSSGTFAFKLFCDRLMVAWYSEESIAAALAAGTCSFMILSFFMGVANYGNAFVAQYFGAKQYERTGVAVWQSIIFSLSAGLLLAIVGTLTANVFYLFGHAPTQAMLEEGYYRILNSGAVFALLNSSLMCFWTGRNKTWTVVIVGFISIFLNIFFNWALIFGTDGSPYLDNAPFILPYIGAGINAFSAWLDAPAMGVVGAGIATVSTDAFSVLIFLVLFLRGQNRSLFGTWPKRVLNLSLLWRMLRFGTGNGMQMFLDIGAFAIFNVLMGMYGIVNGGNVGAAASIAISVNGVSFVPMLGLGAAASILVGHGIGSRNIPFAERSVKNARYLILGYMSLMMMLFEVFPHFLVSIFSPGDVMNEETRRLAVNFLRFAGFFCIADGFFILYGNAIRGAGDTKFSAYVMAFTGWCLFAIPCMVSFWLGASFYVLWGIIVFSAMASATVFYLRYRQGKWKNMTVIEESSRSQRRKGAASVRLSTMVAVDDAVLSLPGDSVDPNAPPEKDESFDN